MNPMIPFACLVSFVAGGAAAWAYLRNEWTSGYRSGIRQGKLDAAYLIGKTAQVESGQNFYVLERLAAELRAM